MLKKLLKFGLEYALRRYQSRSHYGGYSRYSKYGGFGYKKGYYKKRRKKNKLFDLFD
jgi:Zn-finger nucleic acid-binding protein